MKPRQFSCWDVIDIPKRDDVCLGKLHQHVGNVAMRRMMEPLVDEYTTAPASRRQEMNRIIVQAVKLTGGRFLTSEEAWFTEVSQDDPLPEKSIGGIFRSMVSRKRHNSASGDNG